ncbi:hypothetical protein BDR04DRAFT_1123303 [Suillus decipiens]|nr:hypothetical protein BDR04DRAFT_1123303 [Suillus decipiens]
MQKPGRSKAKKLGTLDTGPVTAEAPANNISKEMQKLDTLVGKCKVGVAWMNILVYVLHLKFGTYNDRPKNDTETNKLVLVLKSKGIITMKDLTAISIIISRKQIGNIDALAHDFSEPSEVPELKITDNDIIIVALGQHRLAVDERGLLQKKLVKMAELKNVMPEHEQDNKVYHEWLSNVLGKLAELGNWGIIVYDSSYFAFSLPITLSATLTLTGDKLMNSGSFGRELPDRTSCSLLFAISELPSLVLVESLDGALAIACEMVKKLFLCACQSLAGTGRQPADKHCWKLHLSQVQHNYWCEGGSNHQCNLSIKAKRAKSAKSKEPTEGSKPTQLS